MAKIFAIYMRNLEFQAKKKAWIEKNIKSVGTKKYHNHSDLFSKKNSDILSFY